MRALLAALALLFFAWPAHAVYQCGPDTDDCQCGMNNPYPCCDNGGNCTWWSWDRACCSWGVGLPGWGNANQWAGNAKAHPSYKVLSYPVVGSIATRVAGSYGHVAWVTAVSGSSVTVSEQNCWGGWGHQNATRDKSYYDGGYIVPNDQCQCQPGDEQTQTCGNCGSKQRSCNSSCQWGAWSGCGGEGECAPGESQSQACGECGSESRTCQDDCSWSAYGECSSDASFTGQQCDTGEPGICAQGQTKCAGGSVECVRTSEPTTETCNGKDDDCDGSADEGVCWTESGENPGKPPGAKPDDPSAVAGESDGEPMTGGCGCAFESSGGAPAGASLLALLGLVLARRRRAVGAARNRLSSRPWRSSS